MGNADARRGSRRTSRPTQRPRLRRLRAEILCGPYVYRDSGYVEIKAGRHYGGIASRRSLDDIGVRTPRGAFRLIAATHAEGAHECYRFTGIPRVKRVRDAHPVYGAMFCWLPRAFVGRRLRLTIAPPREKARP